MKSGRFGLSLEHLWSLAALTGVFVFVSTHPIRPDDFWWHLAVGREIVESGRIPRVDTYSYTMAGAAYPSYQMFWLMEVGLYGVYRLGGPALVVFAHSLVITACYGLVIGLARRASGSWRLAAFGGLFAAALGMFDWNVRPQAITFLLGALFLWAIEKARGRPRLGGGWLAAFPLGMLVWVNSHGSFLLGLVLIGLWLGEAAWEGVRLRRWEGVRGPLAALGLALLACLVNPRGLGVLVYVRTLTGNPAVQKLVTEWAPPSFDSLGGALFLGGLLFSAALLALSPRRPSWRELGTFLAFGALGLKTSRGVTWYGLTMGPVLAGHLGALAGQWGWRPGRGGGGSPGLNRLFAGLLLLMALGSLPWFKQALPLPAQKAGLISGETPVQATAFLLAERLPPPVFHAISFGSYLIWAAQPEYRVFVDGRIELYPLELWADYLAISAAQADWEERLASYGVQTLMLSPELQPRLIAAAQASPNWVQVYQDQAAVIFVRRVSVLQVEGR